MPLSEPPCFPDESSLLITYNMITVLYILDVNINDITDTVMQL